MQITSNSARTELRARAEELKTKQRELLQTSFQDSPPTSEEQVVLDRIEEKLQQLLEVAEATVPSEKAGGDADGDQSGAEDQVTWSIKAIVTDFEGAPAAGVEVRLSGPTAMTMASDGRGEALFEITGSGRFIVQAFRDDSESDPEVFNQTEPTEGEVIEAALQLHGAPTDLFEAPSEVNEPTLRKGDEDPDGWVEYLQKLLNLHLDDAGESSISISGKFDSATDKAVRWFQGAMECKVDGIVGNQTWSALREDKIRDAIGTDGREPGSHSEQGAEGRWSMESGRVAVYEEPLDALRLIVASTGTEPIGDFRADIFVDGARQQVSLGDPASSTGGQDVHAVYVTRFRERFGDGPFDIKAYLPQELGGDKWENTVEIPPADGPSGEEDAEWTIDALVQDQDGNALAEASVRFDGPASFSGVTDSSGRVNHEVMGPGRYELTATFDGKDSRKIVVEESDPEDGSVRDCVLTIDLSRGDVPPPDLDVPWLITAIVADMEGNPLAEAGVEFSGPTGFNGVTDNAGRVTHEVRGPSRYELTATLDGKESRTQVVEEVEPDDGEIRECELVIDLGGGDRPEDKTAWVIDVLVQDTEGNPLNDAGVSFAGPLGFNGMTDASGHARHEVEGPSRYELQATFEGKQSSKTIVEESEPEEGEVRDAVLTIDLSGGATPEDKAAWIIDVLVQDTEGNPLNDAGVKFSGPLGFSGSTDASGHVRHEVEGPSRYELQATFEGNESRKLIVEESEPDEGEVRDAVLTIDLSGGDVPPCETEVRWIIEATVKDTEGNPVVMAGVGFDGPVGFNGITDTSGKVSHEAQGPGRYSMKAVFGNAESDTQVIDEASPRDGSVHSVELTIDLTGCEEPDPVTSVKWLINATVKDQDGNPVPRAAVYFDGPVAFTGFTDESGCSSHEAQGPGRYEIEALIDGSESDTQVIDEDAPQDGMVHEVELIVEREAREEEDVDEGNPLLADVEIEIGNDLYGSITAVFDKDGKFTGIDLKKAIAEKGLKGGAEGLIAGGKVEISGALEGRMKGNTLEIKSVLAASGSVMVGLGVASPKAWLGIGAEYSLKFARTIETLTVDFDRSVLENAAKIIKAGGKQPSLNVVFDLPAKYTLSGKLSAILGGGSGSILEGKISKTIKEYNPMIEIELTASGSSASITLTACPGVYEFINDVAHLVSPVPMTIIDEILEIADDPDDYVENKQDQIENTVEKISELPSELREHFSDEIDTIRKLIG